MAPASKDRIPVLDGYRVILVFLVSWYHIWQQSWLTPRLPLVGSLDFLMRSGYVHVDGMILLSGFLLFLPWARHMLEGRPMPDTRAFYERRIQRIVPSYYVFTLGMLLFVALPHELYSSPQNGIKDVFLHLTFLQNQDAYTYLSTPIGVASWTIAVEMQFYLIFPLLARGVKRQPTLTLGLMILAGLCYRGYQLWTLSDYNMVVNQMPAFLDVYAVGMICALAYVRLEKGLGREFNRSRYYMTEEPECIYTIMESENTLSDFDMIHKMVQWAHKHGLEPTERVYANDMTSFFAKDRTTYCLEIYMPFKRIASPV